VVAWLLLQIADLVLDNITAPTWVMQALLLVVAANPVTDKSIAVLPFVDLSEAQDQGWFAKGLADEILNALMRTPDLLPVLANDVKESRVIAQVRQACAEGRRVDDANEVIRKATTTEVQFSRAAWLFYRQFDLTPFPELMAVLARENVDRGPAFEIPFACK
jgi:hypothetical protein